MIDHQSVPAAYGEAAERDAALRARQAAIETDPLRGDGPASAATSARPRKTPFILAGMTLAGLIALGGYHKWERSTEAEQTRREAVDFVPEVRTIAAEMETKPRQIRLPGQTEPFDKAELYARATGYVVARKVDIGSRVKKGDLLLQIAAPDLDEQLLQAKAQIGQMQAQLVEAKANVEQAQANVNLAAVTDTRTSQLAGQGWATKQYADQTKATVLTSNATLAAADARVKVAEANLQAQKATVDRLKALTSFEDVVAPFDGVITNRRVDVGDLVHADSSSGSPLFSMASDAVLRIAVQVPQSAATGIHDGVPARITVPQMPDQIFTGTVSRSSVALRYSSRTLSTEIDVPNPDGVLRPGLYVSVTFDIPRLAPTARIPSEALIFDQDGTQVAVVEADGNIRMQPVTIGRDLGAVVELKSGLKGREAVVVSPPADLMQGQKVSLAPSPKPAQVSAVTANAG